jgi:hypothetical protein
MPVKSTIVRQTIPRWLKYSSAVFLMILVPTYWVYYGPANFLWLSDIILLLTIFGVFFENRLLISMAAVGGLVLELGWGITFVLSVLFKCRFSQVCGYMFDNALPIWVRSLSLFHIVVPFLLLWIIMKWGYVRIALPLQILLTWIVLSTTWFITDPTRNINGVFSYQFLNINAFAYLSIQCLLFALIFLATHKVLVTVKK